MRIKINPTTIAEAVILLDNEDLLTSLYDTLRVLSKSEDIDEGLEFFYFHDGSYITRFEKDIEAHRSR